MKQLYIHIGMRKTGSSALQELLSEQRHLLSELGIDYPNRLTRYPAHQELAWVLFDAIPEYAKVNISREAVYDHYCQVIDNNISKGLVTLLSSEDLSLLGRNFTALSYLKARFDCYNPHVVFFQRDPLSYHVSNYKHALSSGRETRSFSDYVFRLDELLYAHPSLNQKIWRNIFGEGNVQVLKYEPEAFKKESIFAMFLRTVFAQKITDLHLSHKSNVGISNFAAEYFLALNRSETSDEQIRIIKSAMKKDGLPSNSEEFAARNLTETEFALLRSIYGQK